MRHLKKLQKLEEKAGKIVDTIDEELALWMNQNPPEHISINPNSYEEWIETIPPHLHGSFIRWAKDVRMGVEYFERHIYNRNKPRERTIQEPRSDSQSPSNYEVPSEAEPIFASQVKSLDSYIFAI